MRIDKLILVTNLLLILPISLHSANTYNVGDSVPLFVNKIGPLHNPSETYQYYELPFCHPDQVLEKKESVGEILNGDRLANALYKLEFAVNKTRTVLCQKNLNRGNITKFREAISNEFYFQMYYDDLPLWAFIGKVEDENWTADGKGPRHFLFTHVQFDALYNGNQVIEVSAFGDPTQVVEITQDADINVEFTYSIFWTETSSPYNTRTDRFSRASMMPVLQQIHWFSFLNSIAIVVLLMGLLAVLFMRHLKNDLKKWSGGDEEEDKEIGWKHIHGDVFRSPSNMPLFSAVIGSGTQLLTMICILFVLASLGVIYPYSRGSLSTSLFISYILTSVVAGYSSASLCTQYAESEWERSVLLAGLLFVGPFIFTAFILNMLAAYAGITAALPFGTIFVIFLLYAFFAIPLHGLGAVVGHHYKSELQSTPTKKIPKEIPSLSWFRKPPAQMFLGGLLPFSAIILELHNLMASIWGYKIYTTPAILFVTFVLLAILTAMMSICLTYFQLAAEDHEWWWRSILCGGSTSIFMFAYSVYFFLKSNMSGVLQAFFYFGYSACMCYAFFLILGAISFQASFLFVRRICHAVKSE